MPYAVRQAVGHDPFAQGATLATFLPHRENHGRSCPRRGKLFCVLAQVPSRAPAAATLGGVDYAVKELGLPDHSSFPTSTPEYNPLEPAHVAQRNNRRPTSSNLAGANLLFPSFYPSFKVGPDKLTHFPRWGKLTTMCSGWLKRHARVYFCPFIGWVAGAPGRCRASVASRYRGVRYFECPDLQPPALEPRKLSTATGSRQAKTVGS
jgi:hypothetical protein